MRVTLTVLAGPNVGHVVECDSHDGFVVGRSKRTSSRLPQKDGYLSRHHFLLEMNPPLCRVLDLDSRNGTFVNGAKVTTADLHDGDVLKAGHTAFRVAFEGAADAVIPERTAVHSPLGLTVDIPGYRPVREVGRGGMGVVYEAVREDDGQPVALKTIRPAGVPSRLVVERFLREAAILKQLDHPNIVRYLDGGETGGTLWFAMEYVAGVDAAAWVKRHGPMAIADAVAVANDVLRGLKYAHGLGFVHRDVKPSNVLLEPRLEGGFGVKLADFGLARAYDESRLSGLTLTGDVGGTPAFMAPEQILDFRNVGPPVDVYGTAATLYYLLTGAFIFDLPQSMVAAYAMVLEGEPVPIRERRPEVPMSLAIYLQAGLTKLPLMRIRTCPYYIVY